MSAPAPAPSAAAAAFTPASSNPANTAQAQSASAAGSTPASVSEATIRQLNPSLWIFSRPFQRGGAQVGVRMTAIKLENGGVLVYNPTELDSLTKSTLAGIGPVEYIVAPSLVHHLSVDPYKAAFPDAKVIGPDGLAAKHKAAFYKELKWPQEPLGIPGPKGTGSDSTIEHLYLPDVQNQEILLFHKPSKTLCCADLIWNLPANEQYEHASHAHAKTGIITGIAESGMNPEGGLHHALTYAMVKKTPAVIAGLQKVINEWAPETIIPEHGDVITTGAVDRIKHALAWVFKHGDPGTPSQGPASAPGAPNPTGSTTAAPSHA